MCPWRTVISHPVLKATLMKSDVRQGEYQWYLIYTRFSPNFLVFVVTRNGASGPFFSGSNHQGRGRSKREIQRWGMICDEIRENDHRRSTEQYRKQQIFAINDENPWLSNNAERNCRLSLKSYARALNIDLATTSKRCAVGYGYVPNRRCSKWC